MGRHCRRHDLFVGGAVGPKVMLSRIEPVNSQVSCSTMPKQRRVRCREVRSRALIVVEEDAPGVDLVEAHEQVDDRRLAGPGGSDDGDRLARRYREGAVGDERVAPRRS